MDESSLPFGAIMMTHKVEAVYENGVLRPLHALTGIAEHSLVRLTVETMASPSDGIRECIGSMSDEDATELSEIIDREFERVNPSEWR